ncbi:hypothetical protein AVEN_263048-1 [Araneus ventricosus]|uniref:Uncharacterized protein n=1 Tax=Araneus ventricosus TaxID=182803 RepID=A0A4Y2IC49_ARAVE|nr:hypothetical protein AVEN_263048-1 [Araneus ventricosus]
MQTRPHYERLVLGSHPRRYFPSSAMGPSTSQDTTIMLPKRADNRLIYMTASLLRIRGSSLGRGGLVLWSRLRGWKVPGSKPYSTEDPPCMGPVAC